MKTIQKILTLSAVFLLLTTYTIAREDATSTGSQPSGKTSVGDTKEFVIKLNKPGQPGSVKIESMGDLQVENHAGKDVVLTASGLSSIPERAQGLSLVSDGLVDNTGMGVSVQQVDNAVEIRGLANRSDIRYKLLVPSNVSLNISNRKNQGDDIRISGVTNEIEVNLQSGNLILDNVTGPVIANTMHGSIDVKFSKVNPDKPISITSVHGHVDITLPSQTPANLDITTRHGEIYSDITFTSDRNDSMKQVGGSHISGKMNGGGVDIHLQSSHNNVYVRKAK